MGYARGIAAPSPFEHSWPAVPESVPAARRAVVAHLRDSDTPDPPLKDIGLAVSEAASNVVNHAYRETDPGDLRVSVTVVDDEVKCAVEDDGLGMAPRSDSPGLGLGMPLIATVSDRFDLRALPRGGTCLCMWFKMTRAAATLPG